MRRSLGWILTALVPALTLAAMNVAPQHLDKALADQRELALTHPQDSKIFNDLGNLLVLAGHLEEAEQAYRQAIELDPGKASSHFNFGLLLHQMGRYQEAFKEYQKALKLNPSYAWAHYQIGVIHDLWRQDEQAITAYAKAFSLDPQLAFPEVNPNVIDNRLLTEALLKASPTSRIAPLAPKAYDDPGRIAELLVPPVRPAEGEEETGEEAEEASGGPEEGLQPPDEESSPTASRRLTVGDLDPGASSNQATPPGTAGSRRGSAYRPPQFSSRAPRAARIPQPQYQPPPQDQGGQPRVLGGAVGVPSSGAAEERAPQQGGQVGTPEGRGGRVIIPPGQPGTARGVSSTGRLEMRLHRTQDDERAG